MFQNFPQLRITAVDHVSRGESLEIHPDTDKSITEIKTADQGISQLFKLTEVHLDHAEGKARWCEVQTYFKFVLFGLSQTQQKVILVNSMSAGSGSQDRILTYGFLINGAESSATATILSDRDGSSSERPK